MLKNQNSESNNCLFCEAHVTSDFARVYGDQGDNVHRCFACDSRKRVFKGSAAGKDVAVPDPQDHPERKRGRARDPAPGAVVATDGGDSA